MSVFTGAVLTSVAGFATLVLAGASCPALCLFCSAVAALLLDGKVVAPLARRWAYSFSPSLLLSGLL